MLFVVGVCRSKSVSRIPRIVNRSALRYVERKKKRKRERKRERKKDHGYRNHHFPNWLAIPPENPHQVIDRYRLKASLYRLH